MARSCKPPSISKDLSNQRGIYPKSLTDSSEEEVLPRQLQVEFQLRCEKEVEIQAIQRVIKMEEAPSWQLSFSDSIVQPTASSVFQSSSSKKKDPYGINQLRNFQLWESGFVTEVMPCADSYLPSMSSTVVHPAGRFSTTLLDDHIAGKKNTNLKRSLDNSETRRIMLLEKLRQAQLIIQSQTESHTAAEMEICFLQGQLKNATIGKQVLQEELEAVERETSNLKLFKAETVKNRISLLERINKLDGQLKETSQTHKALLAEAQKREAILENMSLALRAIQNENRSLGEEREAQECKIVVLEEEKAHLQQNYTALLREKELLLRKCIETKQGESLLQLGDLPMTRGECDATQDKTEWENLHLRQVNHMGFETNRTSPDEAELMCDSGNNLQWFAQVSRLAIRCKNLHWHLTTVQEENRRLVQEQEQNAKLINLLKTQKKSFAKQQSSSSENLQDENDQLLQKVNEAKLTAEITQLKEKCQKLEMLCVKGQNERERLLRDNRTLSLQLEKALEKDNHTRNVKNLQVELQHISEELKKLEDEKCAVVRDLEEFHHEQGAWSLQKNELEMNQAELVAENEVLKRELKTRNEEVEELKTELEVLRDGAVDRETHADVEELDMELKTLRAELAQVWEMLKVKDNKLETEQKSLKEKQYQLQKLTAECNRGKKSCALLVSKIAQKNQVIFSLSDKLLHEQQVNAELSARVSALSGQVLKTQRKLPADVGTSLRTRHRSKSDSCIDVEVKAENLAVFAKDTDHKKDLNAANEIALMKNAIESLRGERDSAVNDIQDLREGMQQLTEAFEEEMKVLLVMEREKCRQEMELLCDDRLKAQSKSYGQKLEWVTNEKNKLETKSKNLECEQDELRNQIEELCRTHSSSREEKAVQVDSAQWRRESRPPVRKRSKSAGMVTNVQIDEITAGSAMEENKGISARRPRISHRINST